MGRKIKNRRNCANPLDIMATPGVKKKSEREGKSALFFLDS
jgi:hypothetical protein